MKGQSNQGKCFCRCETKNNKILFRHHVQLNKKPDMNDEYCFHIFRIFWERQQQQHLFRTSKYFVHGFGIRCLP